MSRCLSCDAEVEWAWLPSGKRMPLDVETPERWRGAENMVVTARSGARVDAKVVKAGEGDRVSHFATCPSAAKHRKR